MNLLESVSPENMSIELHATLIPLRATNYWGLGVQCSARHCHRIVDHTTRHDGNSFRNIDLSSVFQARTSPAHAYALFTRKLLALELKRAVALSAWMHWWIWTTEGDGAHKGIRNSWRATGKRKIFWNFNNLWARGSPENPLPLCRTSSQLIFSWIPAHHVYEPRWP